METIKKPPYIDKRNNVLADIGGRLVRVDNVMREMVEFLNKQDIETMMCCSGHGKYPPSIIVKTTFGHVIELFSGAILKLPTEERTKYYKLDEEGFYYIPEKGRRYD